MPNDDKNQQPRIGILKRMAGLIQSNSDELYRSTYYSDPSNKQQLSAIKADITASIKDIMDQSADNVGEPNISKLYERMLLNKQNDPNTLSEMDKIFGDNEFVSNLTNSYLDNRWVKAIDTEIDEVCKYMPKLQEALDTIRDNILSADSFSKDFLSIKSQLTDASTSDEQFDSNVKDLKDRYDLLKLIKKIYDSASKYGESFIYCVPYEKAIQKLLDKKYDNRGVVVKANLHENAVFIESTDGSNETQKIDIPDGVKFDDHSLDINIQIENGLISSIIQSARDTTDKLKKVNSQSIFNEAMIDIQNTGRAQSYNSVVDNDLELGGKLPVHHKFDRTLDDSLELPNVDDDTTADGLMTTEGRNNKIKGMNGCIVKELKRWRTVPVILNDVCLGYYYFEFDAQTELFDDKMSTTGVVNTITGLRSNGRSEALDSMQRREDLLRSIANNLADRIDANFVDNNQDLKKEIYYILKYNDDYNAAAGKMNNIRVSYIPPEDVQHIYFNLDEDTGRGISDLNLSLIPAKLWVAIYITNCLAIMTRGNDKRVYYVRQSVESNISKTLLKTINEIKKSNFGIRQVENINSVLNITGRFNDYIIPRGSDGQSPIEFEVMQGQNVEIKTELLNLLEESAINVTGVPIEIIQSRQSPDYAMQLTMSNSKFLRFVYDRQSDFQRIISKFVTKLYDIEYSCTDEINITLPPPLFINVTNTNQLITNTNDYCDNIVNIYMGDEQDDVLKATFTKELKIHYLGSYLNMKEVSHLYDKAKQARAKQKIQQAAEEDNGDNSY